MHRLICLGVDVGQTHPTAAILVGVGVDGRLYAVDEWRHDTKIDDYGARMTVGEQARQLIAWINNGQHTPHSVEPVPEWIATDPSAAAMYDELFQLGVSHLMLADNEVVPGIQLVSSLLAAGRLFISTRCPKLIIEFSGYAWDDKATERGKDQVIKAADDSLDALRYGIKSSQHLWRPLIVAA